MGGHLLVSALLSIVLINDQREFILPAYTSHGGYIAYETVQGSITMELFLEFLRNSVAVCCLLRWQARQEGGGLWRLLPVGSTVGARRL